ncbi:PaaI family thioesterase [Nocardioides acrostichi]|uniref:PaaI family thioesterase n=1 Tax=Nocardioides acrostichi TaxID=2784339 RepID=A0A930YD33_9ACTN|nr:PaaI family thioesterase [Nocardioides acrostichi]MBF4162069.1 PaaI family thioesterase [Nocardioides acrostichi]
MSGQAPGAAGFVGMEMFRPDPTPTAEVHEHEAVRVGLAEAVRDLVDATIRSTVADTEIADVERGVRDLTARLRVQQTPGPFGVRYNDEFHAWNWGNAVVGRANAIAPPLDLVPRDGGGLRAQLNLGAAYEGPPGLVHGGVTMLLLDHLMGEVASAGNTRVTLTGTLSGRYEAPTPLGEVVLEGWITGEEGRKVLVDATIGTVDAVCVRAAGVFIVPSWAASDDGGTSAHA